MRAGQDPLVRHPDDLPSHLATAHGIRPWDIADPIVVPNADEQQRKHHERLHLDPHKPVDHEHRATTDG